MWARHMELALGLWLLGSPFILRHDPSATVLWVHDFVCALLLLVLPLLAHWRPAAFANLLLLPVAAWLMIAGWWATWVSGAGLHPDPAYQNWILVGFTLAMLAVVPTEASKPPAAWRRTWRRSVTSLRR